MEDKGRRCEEGERVEKGSERERKWGGGEEDRGQEERKDEGEEGGKERVEKTSGREG